MNKEQACEFMFGKYRPDDMKSNEGKTEYLMRVLAERDQLAAENAAQREYRPQPSGAAMMEALDAFYEYHEDVPEQGMMAAFEILCCKRPQALATDAWQREQMARGVEAFATAQRDLAGRHPGSTSAAYRSDIASTATVFAAHLRNGEAV
ncbi:hypothetical protein [Pseudescherichia sp.]|uniref:hypothetical protein n=1 Tax=Pseudescherichia sp. TaxID=2055881 RepID=UPI00289D831C|nr:hypothetical protein [Pseudescherichia sp.]